MSLPDRLAALRDRAAAAFAERFGRPPTHAAAAPGRVNLIGEHTDYNGGFVLPMAIERWTVAVGASAAGSTVRIASLEQTGVAEFQADAALKPGSPKWANYVKGVVAGFVARGTSVGFDAAFASDVPLGGGLSSSASLEVAAATLLEGLLGIVLPKPEKAKLCQTAEQQFANMPCGIMDQFASSYCQAGHALLLDCESNEATHPPFADPGVAALIANTGVHHELATSEYKLRREACEAAAKALGVTWLRHANPQQVAAAGLPTMLEKRAWHIVTENARTQAAAQALAAGDFVSMGRLMHESHASLRDDFEVSCAELDVLERLAAEIGPTGGVFGARITGGGFGGCTVNLVLAEAATEVAARLAAGYHARTGRTLATFVTAPAAGAASLPPRG